MNKKFFFYSLLTKKRICPPPPPIHLVYRAHMLHYYSFGATLLPLVWSSVTTPLLELRFYTSFGALLTGLFTKIETAKATVNSKNVILSRLTLLYWLENSQSTFFG